MGGTDSDRRESSVRISKRTLIFYGFHKSLTNIKNTQILNGFRITDNRNPKTIPRIHSYIFSGTLSPPRGEGRVRGETRELPTQQKNNNHPNHISYSSCLSS